MHLFHFTALTSAGQIRQGTLSASSKPHLKNLLEQEHLSLLHCKKAHKGITLPFFHKISDQHLSFFCLQLSELLKAGVSIDKAVEDVAEETPYKPFQRILVDVASQLKTGHSFSKSLLQYAKVFDPIFIQLMATAEQTGEYAATLQRLHHRFEWQSSLKQSMLKALRYPIFFGTAILFLLVLVTEFLLPNMQDFLGSMGIKDLPLSTSTLITFADFLKMYAWPVGIIIAGLSIICVALRTVSMSFDKGMSKLALCIPVIGRLRLQFMVAHLMHNLTLMLLAKMPLLPSLKTAIYNTPSSALLEKLSSAPIDLEKGATLYAALSATKCFQKTILRFVELGEKTGTLPDLLLQSTNNHAKILRYTIETKVNLVEPAMISLMGGILIWIACAVLQPLYNNLAAITL